MVAEPILWLYLEAKITAVRLALLLFPLLLVLSCNKNTTDAAAASAEAPLPANMKIITFGEREALSPGSGLKVAKHSATLLFKEVVSDSRCPRGVNCIRQGEAKVLVLVDGREQTILIEANPKKVAAVNFAGGAFRITDLTPYPDANLRPKAEDRRLVVEVIKTESM